MNAPTLMALLIILPALSAVLIWTCAHRSGLAWAWSMISTTLIFALSLVLFVWSWRTGADGERLINSAGDFFHTQGVAWVDNLGLRFSMGMDSITMWLVMLTTFLMPLVVLGSRSAVESRHREFFGWLMLLQAAMIGTFIARDLIFFYVCFEFTLIPLFFLIGVFGSTDRLKAARVFFLYTFTGSMLTFAGLLYVAWYSAGITGSWTFDIATLTESAQTMSTSQQGMVLLALLAGFAVKVPLFPVHTWLPLAHTEAPTAGSVILAGVLLKLGTYGLIRFALPMVPEAAVDFAPYIGVFAVIGILYTALICWVQKDIKKLIAYSSVSHLGFCVLGIFAIAGNQHLGQSGAVLYMVNHGLATGALFLCVGMIYERFHTREMRQYGGIAAVMPVWSFFFVFFCLASVGLPGLNGFVGEFLTTMGTFLSRETLGIGYAVAAAFGMILGAIYILYMVGKIIFGPLKLPESNGHGPDDQHGHHAKPRDLNSREITTLVPLAAACLFLGLYPTPMLRSLDRSVEQLVEPARQVLVERSRNDEHADTALVQIDARKLEEGTDR
ncbi:MAG: NADH-quinone oxidoreductase subunit M [Phycisphaeraceae bacterium]|nr:NADH-quinone oxidoreductase subunit M [Phycisphaeraceae bacterium]